MCTVVFFPLADVWKCWKRGKQWIATDLCHGLKVVWFGMCTLIVCSFINESNKHVSVVEFLYPCLIEIQLLFPDIQSTRLFLCVCLHICVPCEFMSHSWASKILGASTGNVVAMATTSLSFYFEHFHTLIGSEEQNNGYKIRWGAALF